MIVTDEIRSDLHQYLKETMGEQHGNALMALLPPVGWTDLATKQDLAHQSELTAREFAAVRAEMRSEFAAVRAEMRTGFADFGTELHKTLWTHTMFILGTTITLIGLAVATIRFA